LWKGKGFRFPFPGFGSQREKRRFPFSVFSNQNQRRYRRRFPVSVFREVKIYFNGLACGFVQIGPGTALLQRVVGWLFSRFEKTKRLEDETTIP